MTSLLHRLAGLSAALCTLLTVFVLLPAASSAANRPACIGDNCEPTPWFSTLTIAVPQSGTVLATSAAGGSYTCSAADPSGCTIVDEVDTIVTRRPAYGWPTYTLTWTGPAGVSITWSGACSGTGPCTVTNNLDQQSVAEQVWSTWTSQLLVARPARGAIDEPGVLDCPFGGAAACTITDQQTVAGLTRPTTGWPVHSLTWTGPDGTTATWNGACIGAASAPTCTVTNDQPSAAVGIVLQDVQAPTMSSLSLPSRVGAYSYVQTHAYDNWAISYYRWKLCGPDGCDTVNRSSSSGNAREIWYRQTGGDYTVSVVAVDAAGNISNALAATTTWVPEVHVTTNALPAVSAHPSLTFSTDEDAHVPAAQRLCRAFLADAESVPDFGPCTTDTTYAPDLPEGDWLLQVQVEDDLGNYGYAAQETVVDQTAPAVAITGGPDEGAQVTTTAAAWTFTSSDAHPGTTTCKLDKAKPLACDAKFALPRTADGQHKLVITATDAAGNATKVVRHFSTQVATTLAATPATVSTTHGIAATLGARITPGASTGKVRFTLPDGTVLCAAKLVDSHARCAAPARQPVGRYTLTASYAGEYEPSTTTLTLIVTAATPARVN